LLIAAGSHPEQSSNSPKPFSTLFIAILA